MFSTRENQTPILESDRLHALAIHQRRAFFCFTTLVAIYIFIGLFTEGEAMHPIANYGVLATMLISGFYAYGLAKSLGDPAILNALLVIVPCLGPITLFVLILRANKQLKNAGIKTTVFGPAKKTN